MKKVNVKRTTILFVLIILAIIGIIIFGLSKAQNTKEIHVNFIDAEGFLAPEEGILNAVDSRESGYYITLPETINGKFISYFILNTGEEPNQEEVTENEEEEAIEEQEEVIENEEEEETEEEEITEEQEEIIEEEQEEEIEEEQEENPQNIIYKLPGERIYLTEQEIENAEINLSIIYDTQKIEGTRAYNQVLEKTFENKRVVISGYMSLGAEIVTKELDEISKIEIETLAQTKIDESAILNEVFFIQDNITLYNLQVTLFNTNKKEVIDKYRLAKIDEIEIYGSSISLLDIEDIEPFKVQNNEASFEIGEASTFAIIELAEIKLLALSSPAQTIHIIDEEEWDGTVATGFKYGAGTSGFPYLITDGRELAYLASQVRTGVTYEGIYFQLAKNISLNDLEWTPIGDYTHSFRGIFEGAGHKISNAIITTKEANTEDIEAYGIFGSIGGGASYAEIRNLEINNITVKLGTVTETFNENSGYNIGFVAGTVYNDAKITNCIVKGAEMLTAGSLTITETTTVYSGGIAGSAGTSETVDPGAGHRYVIENCYASADILIGLADGNGISTGGIVGRIYKQPVWPANCLYTGTITNGGYIGPIFGSVVGDVSPKDLNLAPNISVNDGIFNGTGNIGGSSPNLTITSYYRVFTLNSMNFDVTTTNGITPDALTHRIAVTATDIMACFQGINKGIYADDLEAMLTEFNNNLGGNHVSWILEGESFSFKPRHLTLINGTDNEITADIVDGYNVGSYTYTWYINNTLDVGTLGDTYTIPSPNTMNRLVEVITFDGTYYSVGKAFISRTMANEPNLQADIWNGAVASSFKYGNGTNIFPYLITSGKELAYLASQVRAGTTYEGTYFQLTNNLNLNGLEWTPIGNYTNSFRGVFDGAGHKISNAFIQTKPANTAGIEAYGIFGSIGGGTASAEIKNLELRNIIIKLGTGVATFNENSGYNIGFMVGTIYKDAKVTNCIVKGSEMIATGDLTVTETTTVYLGGIAGSVGTMVTGDPGAGHRYAIENCYVSANITTVSTMLGNSNGANSLYISSGGIVGRIHKQPVWPENCLYKGTINTTTTLQNGGYIGPIFGSVVGDEAPVSPSNATNINIDDRIFNGTSEIGGGSPNLTITSYYTNFYAKSTSFKVTATNGITPNALTHRIGIINTDTMACFQGINKGIYTVDMITMLVKFNNHAIGNNVSWEYENGEFSLIERATAIFEETITNTYEAQISDNYNTGTYTYTWYINGALNGGVVGNTYSTGGAGTHAIVIIHDGTYYTIAKFQVGLTIDISFNVNTGTHTVNASLIGTALPYIDIEDYTFKWYIVNSSGNGDERIEGSSLTLTELKEGNEYKLIATNMAMGDLSSENSFLYGTRTVIYVSYSANATYGYPAGNNSNNGLTPATPVQTIENAYTKISGTGTYSSNIIVLMGNYTDNTYLNNGGNPGNNYTNSNYNKQATITGIYGGTDYYGELTFEGEKYLSADSLFQYIKLNGTVATFFHLQGRSVVMGEGLVMDYPYADSLQNLGHIADIASPNFNLIGGYLDYNVSSANSIPKNNSTILIKSGAYVRILAGNRYYSVNASSNNTLGKSTETFNSTIIIDIENSTKGSTYDCDINTLAGGQDSGNIYGNITLDIRNGNIGRVIGGSIGNVLAVPGYPSNSFFGEIHIMVSGGTIGELYGGSLGRARSDVYFYGSIDIDISGGYINSNLYGVGAGGVTGYHASSTDPYKAMGASYTTEVNINVTGGTVNGNLYGAGYGYSWYLSAYTIAEDGGTLYGNSNINISGGTVNGNIYGAGRGYSGYSTIRAELAQMYGNTNIRITGNPTISGGVFGAGEGMPTPAYAATARLTGNSNIYIETGINLNVYGGGYAGELIGDTFINIEHGEITGTIYGGGNAGLVSGTTNIYINGGSADNIYGGGQSSNVTTTNITLQGGTTNNIFGGSHLSGNVTTSNINIISGSVQNLYGGNNSGGQTANANIIIDGGTLTNLYGGGYNAITGTSNVIINNGTISGNAYAGGNLATVNNPYIEVNDGNIGKVYGGGNSATVPYTIVQIQGGTIENIYAGGNAGAVTTSTSLNIIGGIVTANVYGGGQDGAVYGDTVVNISDAEINGNLYAGGNGLLATVYGNTNLTMDMGTVIGTPGSLAPASGSVFGGGSTAPVGTTTVDNSISTINIVGGTIYGNIYGGGHTAVTYGNTTINIGNDVVNDITLQPDNIYIKGNIFGGGEQKPIGASMFTWDSISVTKGININIDGAGHSNFSIDGSIFGSGHGSNTKTSSNINIKNFGTAINPKKSVSIQRATVVTLDNSVIALSGTTDSTDDYFTANFSVNRIGELKLKNNTTIYMNYGANLLEKLSSLVDIAGVETKGSVTVNTDGSTMKNVDNRIYLKENKNLNVAKDKTLETAGTISGMFFLGMFRDIGSPNTTTGVYSFVNGSPIINDDMFESNSYVWGMHYSPTHNTKIDGFYTNYNENDFVKVKYIEPTPEDTFYYIWTVGGEISVTTFEFELIASKYATFGTHELLLMGFDTPNTNFDISELELNLNPSVSLIDNSNIETIAPDPNDANYTFGLYMNNGLNGWQTNSYTEFYTAEGGTYVGSTRYSRDNSSNTPSLGFHLVSSKNVTLNQTLGTVRIRFQVLAPVDAWTYGVSYIDIIITLKSVAYEDYFYEAAIAPGEEFKVFPTQITNITARSKFSTYYSLYIDNLSSSMYNANYGTSERVLTSLWIDENVIYPFVLPENTKITMLDLVQNKAYYYEVTADDEFYGKSTYRTCRFY